MVCLLNPWEWQDWSVNRVLPDCRNHRHISRRRAYEHFGEARFADRILAHVYDAQQELMGFIVEVVGRVRWCQKFGVQGCEVWINAACIRTIDAHLSRFQAMIDAGQRPFEIINLPKLRGSRPGIPPRDAVVSKTLRSHSPCALTAQDSELNAEGKLRERRTKQER